MELVVLGVALMILALIVGGVGIVVWICGDMDEPIDWDYEDEIRDSWTKNDRQT